MATVQIQEPQRLLIGGEWVDAGSGRRWESSGPVDGEPASEVAAAGAEDVRRAVEEFTELRWITVGGAEGRHYPI